MDANLLPGSLRTKRPTLSNDCNAARETLLTLQPRRAALCDVVRTINLSPLSPADPASRRKPKPHPFRFDAHQLAKNIAVWKKKFPSLSTILYRYPLDDEADAFVVHLSGETIHVELESQVRLQYPDTFTMPPPSLPETPALSSPLHLKHNIAIHVSPRPWGEDAYHPPRMMERVQEYQRLMYGADSDGRITSINDTCLDSDMHASPEQLLSFLASRASRGCDPITGIRFPSSPTPYTLERFHQMASAIGSGLRTLAISIDVMESIGGLHFAISELDKAFPALEVLTIRGATMESDGVSPDTPLVGMVNLRSFSHEVCEGVTLLEHAQGVQGLGSRRTSFYLLFQDDPPGQGRLTSYNAVVQLGKE